MPPGVTDSNEYDVVPCPNKFLVTDSLADRYTDDLKNDVFQYSLPNDNEISLSCEDRKFLKVMGAGIHKNNIGNWEMPLPFRQEEARLPNNRNQAVNRLNSLLRTLQKKPQMERDYLEFMEKGFNRGHASPIPPDELRTPEGRVWYIPHFGVYHPKKPTQIRVVFNSSAESKAVATFGLRKTAADGDEEFGTDVTKFVHRNFSVDDGLTSLPTAQQAIDLVSGAQAALATSNLRLHKLVSNNVEVMEAFPMSDRAKDLRDLDLRKDSLPAQRSLGVYWDIEKDTFTFRVSLPVKPFTRRGVLSVVNSIYDPLGLVAPAMLEGKKLLQQLVIMGKKTNDKAPLDGTTLCPKD
ncbi:hypothetical protein QZH41_012617 [Actinostola sp. cb2023]|nr:hypothetical protein QZH41_012617 [Actinostola sp. cb2023]